LDKKWLCETVTCGYVYKPDNGDSRSNISSGTRFEELPATWKCPVCGTAKNLFRPVK
jgi:rubredoxin